MWRRRRSHGKTHMAHCSLGRIECGIAAVLCMLVFGCGSGEGDAPAGETGGNGGMPGAGGAQSAGGSAGGGAGGAAAVPDPAFDCSTEQGNYCMSLAGTLDGKAFELICRADTAGYRVKAFNGWSLNCSDSAQQLSEYLSLPKLSQGSFSLPFVKMGSSTDPDLRLSFASVMKGAGTGAENFDSGSVQGTFDDRSTTTVTDVLISGTFDARWNSPAPTCGTQCAAVAVKGNFRAHFDF
jgi:hypothetical protein